MVDKISPVSSGDVASASQYNNVLYHGERDFWSSYIQESGSFSVTHTFSNLNEILYLKCSSVSGLRSGGDNAFASSNGFCKNTSSLSQKCSYVNGGASNFFGTNSNIIFVAPFKNTISLAVNTISGNVVQFSGKGVKIAGVNTSSVSFIFEAYGK